MTNLYFNANLYELTRELQKYNTKENIEKFFEDLDSIYVLQEHKYRYKKEIIYYHNQISIFIKKTYLNKLKLDMKEKIITKEECNKKIDKYTNDIDIAFESLELYKNKTRGK